MAAGDLAATRRDHGSREPLAAAPPPGFVRRWIFSTDHKVIGKQYYFLALFAAFLGMALSLLMRWHLIYPDRKIAWLEKLWPEGAAGGIMTGRQMAAAMAMGAAGAWTGSVWLAAVESETTEIFREKMIAASSRDAVRSRGRTGKPARQLRSVWTDAWDRAPESPGALPMPLQSIISRDAFNSIDRAAAAGNAQARDLVSYFVGQGVGLVDSVKSAGAVVQEFKEEFIEAVEHMNSLVAD